MNLNPTQRFVADTPIERKILGVNFNALQCNGRYLQPAVAKKVLAEGYTHVFFESMFLHSIIQFGSYVAISPVIEHDIEALH